MSCAAEQKAIKLSNNDKVKIFMVVNFILSVFNRGVYAVAGEPELEAQKPDLLRRSPCQPIPRNESLNLYNWGVQIVVGYP